jgi:hypothetical protein
MQSGTDCENSAHIAADALTISDLRKVYRGGVVGVDGVSFRVARGDFFGFLGPNGAGCRRDIYACARFDPDGDRLAALCDRMGLAGLVMRARTSRAETASPHSEQDRTERKSWPHLRWV